MLQFLLEVLEQRPRDRRKIDVPGRDQIGAEWREEGEDVVADLEVRGAVDAVELVEVDFDPLPAVVDMEAALEQFEAPSWQVGQMYLVQAYVENEIGEHFCSGSPFSTVEGGREVLGEQLSATETFERALAANSVYFWDDPVAVFRELRRVLIPGGRLAVSLRTRAKMEDLPITLAGYTHYEPEEVQRLAQRAGFSEGTVQHLDRERMLDCAIVLLQR